MDSSLSKTPCLSGRKSQPFLLRFQNQYVGTTYNPQALYNWQQIIDTSLYSPTCRYAWNILLFDMHSCQNSQHFKAYKYTSMTVKLPDVYSDRRKDSIYDWEELSWDRDRDGLPSLVYKKRQGWGLKKEKLSLWSFC